MDVATLLERLGLEGERRADGWWVVKPGVDVRQVAQTMRDEGVRLVTLSGVPGDDQGNPRLRILYHWEVGAGLLTVETEARDLEIESIAGIWPAADWPEREIRDYFGVEFLGRESTPPLMLREGDPPGFYTRTAGLGRAANPAATAREAVAAAREKGETR
jgi:NADH:ubiquinone oxidoreductase subunit C